MTRRASAVAVVVLGAVLLIGGVVATAVGGRPAEVAYGPPADGGAGPGTVVLSADARSHAEAVAVRNQLQAYFDAINARDYAAWRATVVQARAEALREVEWNEAYATTRDGSVRVDRIDDLSGGDLLVRLRFVSTQDPAQAPAAVQAERICWRNSLPMTGSPPRIAETRGGSSVPEAC